MAFQNDPGPGYVVNEPNIPYKQITQAYWGGTTYTLKQRLGLNLRLTYNSSRSGMRPDVNPADAALLGNQSLIAAGTFDPSGLFAPSVANVQFASTQISEVVVPQWIGQSKAYYRFPNKFEGGLVFGEIGIGLRAAGFKKGNFKSRFRKALAGPTARCTRAYNDDVKFCWRGL